MDKGISWLFEIYYWNAAATGSYQAVVLTCNILLRMMRPVQISGAPCRDKVEQKYSYVKQLWPTICEHIENKCSDRASRVSQKFEKR